MSANDDGAGPNPSGTIRVIGIGQSLRGDDGAGPAAVRLWQKIYPEYSLNPDVQVELAELPGIGLLDLLKGARVAILVDAIQSGDSPGMIHQLTLDQLISFESGSGSAHGWGVAESLSLGCKLDPANIPAKLYLLGIEVGQVGLGEKLSPAVESALPAAAHLVERLVQAALLV